MKFAKYTFLIAGIYGLIALLPQYFMEEKTGRDYPPAINHPEYYYGFIGVAVAFQVLFLIISRNPARFRPAMIAAVIEKLIFAIPVYILFFQARVPSIMVIFGTIDLLLAALFIVAYLKTPPEFESAK